MLMRLEFVPGDHASVSNVHTAFDLVDARKYTHTFVWAFSVMTSSSPFLPPSLGNTYRLFPLLVFRAEESRTKMS